MRTRRANEEYFEEERKNRRAQLVLYKKQDKQLIDKMISDYKKRHAFSTGIIIAFIVTAVLFTYLNLK